MPGKRKSNGYGNDRWPQYLVFSGEQTANDTTTTATVPLPIAAYQQSGLVVEMLKLWVELGNIAALDHLAGTSQKVSVGLTTRSTGMGVADETGNNFLSDPFVVAEHTWFIPGCINAGTSGGGTVLETVCIDLQDAAGHGQMIVTPNLYLTIQSTATAASVAARCRMLYRVRKMPLQEYLGYFQAQQPAN